MSAPQVPDEEAEVPSHPTLVRQHAPLTRWTWWLRNFLPGPVRVGPAEAIRVAVGVVLGLLLTGLLSRWWGEGLGQAASTWMLASLGASAVLLFGMPASPLAQPWPVLAGSALAALVGTVCALWVPDVVWACAIAVGLTVLLMVPLRCMHPPGVGLASFIVLEGINGVNLLAYPLLPNVLVLVLAAVIYNGMTGKRYPHPQHSYGMRHADAGAMFTPQDLDAALQHYNQMLDISRADLEGMLHMVGHAAFRRSLGSLRCQDIMSQPVFAVEAGVALKEALALMRQERVKALPVIDAQRQVLGVLSQAEFLRHSLGDGVEGWGQRLKSWVGGVAGARSTVQQVMDGSVKGVSVDVPLVDLLPIFSRGGVHHLPVVDARQRLVGIVTQTDLIRALVKAVGADQVAAETTL